MTESLTVKRIGMALEQFKPHVDMSDYAAAESDERTAVYRSRAVAALALMRVARIDAALAGSCITDGGDEGGIDAFYFDQATSTLYLATSKWGKKSVDMKTAGEFCAGIRDLLSGKLERFSDKFKGRSDEIDAAMQSLGPVVLITVDAASDALGPHAQRKIDDLLADLNEVDPMGTHQHLGPTELLRAASASADPPAINLTVSLRNWGPVEAPYRAVYGRIYTGDIAEWWRQHGNSLFHRNLRDYLIRTDVNQDMLRTLANEPEDFWYFNNGITMICETLSQAKAGAGDRQAGVFDCKGASVVNGAQTVGSIGRSFGAGSSPEDAWAQVRIIELKAAAQDFHLRLSRATNLQNRVEPRDFVALDPRQHELVREFAYSRRRYALKSSGTPDPQGEEGCSFPDAAVALACAHSAYFAVTAKRNVGELWANPLQPPYTELFSKDLTAARIWSVVQVMRAVEGELHKIRRRSSRRKELVATHMNRIILHLVFREPEVAALLSDTSPDEEKITRAARAATVPVFNDVAAYLDAAHSDEYLGQLCKNGQKCGLLAAHVSSKRAAEEEAL